MNDTVVVIYNGEPVSVPKEVADFLEQDRKRQQAQDKQDDRHITFTCPNGRKCRDSSLHDETFLKENLEKLFAYRQATGFCPGTLEPDEGWMGELAAGLVQLGRALEREADLPQLPTPPVWTDSKLRRREALKKLAMGQKLSHDTDQQQTM